MSCVRSSPSWRTVLLSHRRERLPRFRRRNGVPHDRIRKRIVSERLGDDVQFKPVRCQTSSELPTPFAHPAATAIQVVDDNAHTHRPMPPFSTTGVRSASYSAGRIERAANETAFEPFPICSGVLLRNLAWPRKNRSRFRSLRQRLRTPVDSRWRRCNRGILTRATVNRAAGKLGCERCLRKCEIDDSKSPP